MITDKVAQGDLSIQHMETNNMWADVNTKSAQGLLFRKFCCEMMGVPVEHDNGVEQRNTHPMLLPKVEIERLTIPEKVLLNEITVLVPVKRKNTSTKVPTKGVPRGGKSQSISSRSGATTKQRSVLGESKYGPRFGPPWKAGGSHYPKLYKALLQEPSRTRRTMLLEDNSQAELAYWNMSKFLLCNARRTLVVVLFFE